MQCLRDHLNVAQESKRSLDITRQSQTVRKGMPLQFPNRRAAIRWAVLRQCGGNMLHWSSLERSHSKREKFPLGTFSFRRWPLFDRAGRSTGLEDSLYASYEH